MMCLFAITVHLLFIKHSQWSIEKVSSPTISNTKQIYILVDNTGPTDTSNTNNLFKLYMYSQLADHARSYICIHKDILSSLLVKCLKNHEIDSEVS